MRKLNKASKIFLALIVFSVLLYFADKTGLTQTVYYPLQKIFVPVQLGVYKTSLDVKNFLKVFGQISSLKAKESKLIMENAALVAENARLKKLEEENRILKDQLGVREKIKKMIPARVIGKHALYPSRLVINKGSKDGVVEGDPVVLKDIFIGQIVSVGPLSSILLLPNDSESKIQAITENNTKGLLIGSFGNKIVFDRVLQNADLNDGDIVFTLGQSNIPDGFVLGKVTKVEREAAAVFQKAYVESLVDLDSLSFVFIVK